jgi:hypothetical protein
MLYDPGWRFAVHFNGIAPFFYCPAINRTSAGGSLVGSVPMSSFVLIVMVSGRSLYIRNSAMLLIAIWTTEEVTVVRMRRF